MVGIGYVLLWIVLIILPIYSAWKKRWLVSAVYAAGCLIFLYSVLQHRDGWEDLADIATLIVVVIPVYLIASIIWLIGTGKKRSRR
ncbi:hypothetical protein [Cohnella candidum]|uniref:Uncharacterized protein n=1 Tax=Cohnella candidum TaxID=2674991 RepID=A0A3G3JXB8_9BACL|nr:hypothetical protein [Cohnella candidum]AYQ72501.1 hypothetical protein EAV92_07930 [Cohnella candidum]